MLLTEGVAAAIDRWERWAMTWDAGGGRLSTDGWTPAPRDPSIFAVIAGAGAGLAVFDGLLGSFPALPAHLLSVEGLATALILALAIVRWDLRHRERRGIREEERGKQIEAAKTSGEFERWGDT